MDVIEELTRRYFEKHPFSQAVSIQELENEFDISLKPLNDSSENLFIRNVNFKGESFLNCKIDIGIQLEAFKNTLITNLANTNRRFQVKELKTMYRDYHGFNRIFADIPGLTNQRCHKGLYLFAQIEKGNITPVYIGISNDIKKRFIQHTKKRTKNEATWAFMMAKYEFCLDEFGEYRRMYTVDPHIETQWIIGKQKWIDELYFTFHIVDDNYLMQLAEVYCAAALKCTWNSFEPH